MTVRLFPVFYFSLKLIMFFFWSTKLIMAVSQNLRDGKFRLGFSNTSLGFPGCTRSTTINVQESLYPHPVKKKKVSIKNQPQIILNFRTLLPVNRPVPCQPRERAKWDDTAFALVLGMTLIILCYPCLVPSHTNTSISW